MHPKEDLLRAFIDQELSGKQSDLVKEHLRRCPDCAGRLSAIQARAKTVNSQLTRLAPTAREQARSAQTAYHQFSSVQKEITPTMLKKRSLWVFVSVVAVLVVAFSFTPVRTWASSLLSLFRVQQVTVVSFDPQAAREGQASLANSEDTIRQLFNDNLEITEQGEVTELTDPDDVAGAVSFSPRAPYTNMSAKYYVKPAMQANFTIDQPTMQSLLDSAGVDVQIPAAVDGAVVKLEVPAALASIYGDCPVSGEEDILPQGCTALVQMPSPTVNAPAGLDVAGIGAALLQFLGYSEADARAMSANIDWTTTLILPVPQGEGITYEDVSVDGVQGTFLTQAGSDQYFLVWVKDGMLYALQGTGTLEDAQAFATFQ